MEYLDRQVYALDYQFLEDLDNKCYWPKPWSIADFRDKATVLLRERQPVGYGVYKTRNTTTQLLRLGVHPLFRRRRGATRLLDYIIEITRCRALTVVLRESNEAGRNFLLTCRYPVINTSLMTGWFDNDDGIHFKLRTYGITRPDQT